MSIAAPEPKANMGQPIPRYDAVAKVTGKAQYGADVPLMSPVYAYLVTSSIAKGRIDGIDLSDAKRLSRDASRLIRREHKHSQSRISTPLSLGASLLKPLACTAFG